MNTKFSIKLITGETIYGDIVEKDDALVIISNPLVSEDVFLEDGTVTSTLIKYFATSDEDEIAVSIPSIVSMAKMNKEFKEYYDASVVIQNIAADTYKSNISKITTSMNNYINEHYAISKHKETGELIAYQYIDSSKSNTIH